MKTTHGLTENRFSPKLKAGMRQSMGGHGPYAGIRPSSVIPPSPGRARSPSLGGWLALKSGLGLRSADGFGALDAFTAGPQHIPAGKLKIPTPKHMIRKLLFPLFQAALLATSLAYEVKPISPAQAAEYKLEPSFYEKGLLVQDILIATSGQVADHTILEAAYQFDMVMKTIKADVASRIREQKVLCVLVGKDELTSDMPQFKSDKKDRELAFYNWRQRGFLTNLDGRPTVLFAEEDVMEYEGGMQIESILIHEFGHVIDRAGFDERQRQQLEEAFNQAKAKGLWQDGLAALRFRRVKGDEPVLLLDALVKAFPTESPELLKRCLDGGDIRVNEKPADSAVKVTGKDKVLIVFGGPKDCYASKNKAEYFAEGVQCWFDTNRTMDHDHNHIHTREQLKAYDPGLAKLCEEVLGDTEWRFISPRARAGKDHLAGYDPAKSPVVTKADFIETAALDYYDEYWSSYWQRLRDKYSAAFLQKIR
jgi:hypothetical protein